VTALPHRPLGALSVSAVSLGCMNLSHGYAPRPDEAAATRLLNDALDRGVTMLDTAALYGFGENERLLGRAVMHRRGEFTLASKCVLDDVDGKRGIDGRPEAIASAVDRSLARLGTDHIDLHYLHRLDPNVPVEDSVGALVRAKEAGKIGAIGLSEMSAATIRRAHAVHPIAAVQSEYSPIVRNVEVAVLATCAELGIGFVAFSPVSRGLLAGAVRSDDYGAGDLRATLPRFNGDRLRHNLAAVAAFERLAADLGYTPAQLSLAWVLSRGSHVVALPGTTRTGHLAEDVAATGVTLSDETVARIDAIFARGRIVGARYAAAAQSQVDTETLPGEELE
jgi:aryl-alcohol dehydrogenase-like predicted oxidoreductase